MSLVTDIAPYVDVDGLVQDKPGGESGNGLLYTAEYIYALLAQGEFTPAIKTQLMVTYASCTVQLGLMARTPLGTAFSTDQEGPDDYYGCGAASSQLGGGLAKDILAYGRAGVKNYNTAFEDADRATLSKWLFRVFSIFGWKPVQWVYNNDNPGYFTQSSWLGRQQNLICHLQFAAGEKPPLWRKLWWCVAVLGSMWSTNNDSFCLSWLCVRTASGKSWICDLAAKIWWKSLLKKWPGGMGQVLGNYFQNPSHPLAVYTGIGK